MPGSSAAEDSRTAARFAVPPKLFKIGEVMRYTGIGRQTLHNYTVMGLIHERSRTESGHRLYGADVFDRLRRINDLKSRMTLLQMRRLFEREEQADSDVGRSGQEG